MLFPLFFTRLTDEKLMEHAAKGSEQAFTELYNRYARRLQGFLFRQLGHDHELAADFCHDAFLRIYVARRQYQKGQSFKAWLFTVAYNLCKNHYRHQQVVKDAMEDVLLNDSENTELQAETAQADVELKIDQQQFDDALRQVISQLPSEARLLFALRFEEELSVAQVAAIMQLPIGTVKSRQHKIMKHIKQKLQDYETR